MGYGGARGKPPKADTSNYKDRHVAFVPSKPHPDSYYGNNRKSDPKTNRKVKFHNSANELDFSDTESSSSSSSSDEFIQVNPKLPPKSPTPNIPKPNNVHGPTKPFNHKLEKVDVSSEALYRLEESLNDSPVSASRFSDVTHESLASSMSPLQYPPIQLMDRQGAFDPNRIPASIFGRPSSPMEWSVTSNDSLFSIRIGNSSFSREHVSATNAEFRRSEEMPKSEEFSKEFHESGETSKYQLEEHYDESREIYRSEESRNYDDLEKPADLIKITQITPSKERVKSKENMGVASSTNDDVATEADDPIDKGPTNIVDNRVDEIMQNPRNCLGGNHILDKRGNTMQSPAKTKKKKFSCSLCYSPDCSRTLSCFKWPSCSCKSCLRWPSCSCKSCLSCPSCSCKSCLSSPSCSCKSCLSCPSCSCKSCLHWPSCCSCKSLQCTSCSCKCFKWPSCSSCKCFHWPKCSSKCLRCQCCSCEWLSCKGCSWDFFSCKSCCTCPKWPSCKFTYSSLTGCCRKCPSRPSCISCCSLSKKTTSKRRWSCFSCSGCSSCNSCALC